MPAPLSQNKYKDQVENNIDLRNEMRTAFIQACDTLSNASNGPLERFDVTIDGIIFGYRQYDQISINEQSYNDCSPILKKQAYDRLEKFMKIALEKYNIQYNL